MVKSASDLESNDAVSDGNRLPSGLGDGGGVEGSGVRPHGDPCQNADGQHCEHRSACQPPVWTQINKNVWKRNLMFFLVLTSYPWGCPATWRGTRRCRRWLSSSRRKTQSPSWTFWGQSAEGFEMLEPKNLRFSKKIFVSTVRYRCSANILCVCNLRSTRD